MRWPVFRVSKPSIAQLEAALKRDYPNCKILSKQEAVARWEEAREHLWVTLRYPEVVFYEVDVPGETHTRRGARYGVDKTAYLSF